MSTDDRRTLARFLTADGRFHTIPSKRAKRLVVLDHLAQSFEPGRIYPEAKSDETLSRFHPNRTALRRHLVDEQFLTREKGHSWRSGGTFDV